jgi:hypothetical protein
MDGELTEIKITLATINGKLDSIVALFNKDVEALQGQIDSVSSDLDEAEIAIKETSDKVVVLHERMGRVDSTMKMGWGVISFCGLLFGGLLEFLGRGSHHA